MNGCFVHLQRSIMRKVGEKGHKKLYETDAQFRKEVNMIPALAFVPVEDVGNVMSSLRLVF